MRKYNLIFLLTLILTANLLLSSCSSNNSNQTSQQPSAYKQNNEQIVVTQGKLNASAEYIINCGLVEADKYRADNFVSRLVAVQLIADITGIDKEAEASSCTHPFIDLSDRAEKQISFLYHYGIIQGVTDNSFMEDEICNLDTFLEYLLRALDFIGGGQSDVTLDNAREKAIEAGIISGEKQGDGLFSVNDAFDICRNALYAYINDEETLLTYLSKKGLINISDIGDYSVAYEITGSEEKPFFEERFDDKHLDGYNIKSAGNRIYWHGSNVKGTDNSITDDGYLELAGKQQDLIKDQQFALSQNYMQGNESFGMTFTVNVSSMGNEGNEGRVIFRVIPRTADDEFTRCYAINYYMVLPLGNYYSNLARCKWSITNTNAPTGTAPLVESSYLLKENVDYTARLLIENTEEGNVHIAFYIEGADRYTTDVKPLLEYTDSSEYKIMQSAQGPAFGNSGYKNSGWGFASDVRFDDVRIYDAKSFAALTAQRQQYCDTPAMLEENDKYASQLRYLLNNGIIKPYQRHVDFSGNISVAQFLASAMYLNGTHMGEGQPLEDFVALKYRDLFKGTAAAKNEDLGRDITRYEAAVIISKMMRGNPGTQKYSSLYKDKPDKDYIASVCFAVQNSYLLLDENNNFNGSGFLTRQDMLRVFACAVDSGLRDKNYRLQIPAIYSDRAIIQGGKPVPISGRGMSGDTVIVSFAGQKKSAKVIDGKWEAVLDSMPYGGPYDLKISDSGYSYTFERLYVGEVFIVAGQSNAEWSVYDSDNNRDTLVKFNNQSSLRLFRPVSRMATTPYYDTETKWEVAFDQYSEQVLGTASAVGVFYIQKLMSINPQLKGVRIGLVQITYGGTSIEMFEPGCVGEKNGIVQKDNEFIASGFWNGYMNSIPPFAAKALIYYQGENSAHLEYLYEPMLRDYIWGVRQQFQDPSLPVMLVQLAGYGENSGQDIDSWPKIREIQMRVANTTDNVGLVTAVDLSDKDPENIHPTNKRPIGDRLAYLAMDMIYGYDEDRQSPKLTGFKREGSAMRLTFDADKLYIKQEAYGNVAFEILGADGKWIPAQFKIEGNTLLVWDDMTVVPQGVRYAWANYPKACLFDENGMPVLPFNTTRDLNTAVSWVAFTTNEHYLKKAYHLLNNGDAIINLTRNNAFRYVRFVNAYMLEYTEDIPGQLPGDTIVLLSRQPDAICGPGTTETVVSITDHGIKAGDWLRNTKYDKLTQVLEVIDGDTVRVSYVSGQSDGNVFEVYKNAGVVTAEK